MALEDSIRLGLELSEAHFSDEEGKQTHALYFETSKLARDISVHYVYGSEPGDLIDKRRPSEPKPILDYRKEVYRQLTFAWANKIVGVQRGFLFNPDLYRIEFPENEPALVRGESLKDYIDNVPGIGSLMEYFQEFVLQFANVDPNGYFAILPEDYNSDDLTEYNNPIPEYIPSEHVLNKGRNWIFVQSTDTVPLKNGEEGVVNYLFTPNETLRFEYTGASSNNKPIFVEKVVEVHNRGEMMAKQIGGIVSANRASVLDKTSQIFYLSHVTPTIPFFDKSLVESSDLDGAMVIGLFPGRYEMTIDCHDCTEGIGDDGGNCSTCQGRGVIPISEISGGSGPYMTYSVDTDESGKLEPPAGYIRNPEGIAAIAKQLEIIQFNIKEAYRAVNMESVMEGRTAQRTAEETRDDNKLFENFLIQCSQTVFPLCQWILDSINWSRYSALLSEEKLKENRIMLHAPISYDTTNPMSVLDRIKLAGEANIDSNIVSKLTEIGIPKLFGNSSMAGKVALAYIQCDPFPGKSIDDILAMQAVTSNLDSTDIELKVNLNKYVHMAIEMNMEFLDLPVKDKREFIATLIEVNQPLQIDSTPTPEGA